MDLERGIGLGGSRTAAIDVFLHVFPSTIAQRGVIMELDVSQAARSMIGTRAHASTWAFVLPFLGFSLSCN